MQPLHLQPYQPVPQTSSEANLNHELSQGINNYSPRRRGGTTMTSLLLRLSIGVLMLCAALEMALISSMVYWLHHTAGGAFQIRYNGSSFSLHGKPVGLLADQGHTSNGAAGTAFVAIGLGGIVALTLRNRIASGARGSGFAKGFYFTWLTIVLLNALLSIAALIYTFLLTSNHSGQAIDVAVASKLNNQPYPNYVAYPDLLWTPENWFTAVLELDLVEKSVRSDIHVHLITMKAWRWNLIPLVVLSLLVAGLAVLDTMRWRRESRMLSPYGAGREGKRISA